MTVGVGGSAMADELGRLASMRDGVVAIGDDERRRRIGLAAALMREQGIDALWLDASTSLYYFTGMRIRPSERVHGALVSSTARLVYVCPAFEEAKTRAMMRIDGELMTWQEHEDPTALVIEGLKSLDTGSAVVALDEATPFFVFDGLRRAGRGCTFVNGSAVTAPCRMIKSDAEIALMDAAMAMTLEVHRAAARILDDGISTTDVTAFIDRAHRRVGADGGSAFCIVLFGERTAYPHGVPWPQTLRRGDMVLIDTGCTVDGYHSDITRSYVFGEAGGRQREIWNLEKQAQAAAFAAARVGAPCEAVDAAARRVIETAGLGPGYAVPGLPHRTGHGIGLDVHEWTYLVRGNRTPLAPGMCFSNEPMICLYGEFGVRLEDHFHMTGDGPRWFTTPAHSVDDPFALESSS